MSVDIEYISALAAFVVSEEHFVKELVFEFSLRPSW